MMEIEKLMILPNYLWWQQEGYTWEEEVEHIKNFQLIYHLQELVLLDYFQNSRCKRILEFGCGFGRHLKYLREIPDLEVFGYDQSRSMVASITNWAEPDWIKEYIKIGNPGDMLPYPDHYFDIVFTTSVLIHIPPQHIKQTIQELLRVAKYQVIHLEPSPNYEMALSAHNGSWNHNLVEFYESIGYQCEILKPAFNIQRFYRVLLNANETDRIYTPANIFLEKLLELDSKVQHILNDIILERNNLAQQCDAVSQERDNLAQQFDIVRNNLQEILDSRTWKTIQVVKNNYYVKILGNNILNILESFSTISTNITRKHQIIEYNISPTNTHIYDHEFKIWLKKFKENNKKVLAVYVPNWLGINSATKNMFEDCYPITEHLSENQALYYAKLLLSNGVKHLITAGVSPGHLQLVNSIKQLDPEIRCDVTWHGSYLQNCEDYAWSMIKQLIHLAKRGIIYKCGFAKKGMEETFRSMGLRAEFLPNFVNAIPESATMIKEDNPQLGIWLSGISYRKLPYAMIASAHLLGNVDLNMAGVGDRAKEWTDALGVNVKYYNPHPIPREELHQRIKNTHLSLYLTSSECAPMLPIESLSLGVPCLISPVSHWFEDDEYLHSRLVVTYPERPEIIAKYIIQALEEREKIIERYKIYVENYNSWAKLQVQKFLSD